MGKEKAELEQLLNSLIEKGWKPFGDENVKEIRIYSDMDMECIYWKKKSDFYYFSPRKITSKESWLWQFVCENKLLKPDHMKQYNWYEYRLIESSLKDESELEDFLLSSIKLD